MAIFFIVSFEGEKKSLLSGIEIALTSNRLNIGSKNTFSESF